MLKWVGIEILVLVNALIFSTFVAVILDMAAKRVSIGAAFFWETYFEAKKKFLKELSDMDIPEELRSEVN